MATIKPGEAYTASFSFMQFSGVNATGLSGSATLLRDGVQVQSGLALTQSLTDNTEYAVAITGDMTATEGTYQVKATVTDDAASVTVINRVQKSEPVQVNPEWVSDITTLHGLVDIALTTRASSIELTSKISEVLGAIDGLAIPPDDTATLAIIEDYLLDVLDGLGTLETEADAIARYANIIATVQTRATPADIPTPAQIAAEVGEIPSASSIATAVWGVLTSALTGVGTIGKGLVDGLANMLLVKAKTDLLGTATVTVTSPLSTDGETLTIKQGDAYQSSQGWSPISAEVESGIPDLTGTTVTFETGGTSYAASATASGDGYIFAVSLTSAQTTGMVTGTYEFVAKWPLADGATVRNEISPLIGQLIVE